MRYAREGESHLDAAQGAGEHQLVERPQVSDAEDLAGQPAEAGPRRVPQSTVLMLPKRCPAPPCTCERT